MSYKKKFLRGLAGLALACSSAAALAVPMPYTSLVVFGDSLSDGGNDFLYTGGNFPGAPYAQRFSNGPVAAERLAANLGLPLAPSLAGGTNHAYGGAESGTLNYLRYSSNPFIAAAFGGNNTGVLAQVAGYTAANTIGPSALVMLWAGPNDLFSVLTSGGNPVLALAAAIGNVQSATLQLYAAGARKILLPNMPDVGITPFGMGSGNAAGISALVQGFNAGLHTLVGAIEAAAPGLDIVEFDTFGVLNTLYANPGSYGFTNVTQPCFNGVAVCATPDSYLFWDTAHPTARAHAILGDFLATAVPEPASVALVAVGLLAAGAARRRSGAAV